MAKNFRFVKIDNCNMSKNTRFGLSVFKFYGLVHVMGSRTNGNFGHGITLTTDKSERQNTISCGASDNKNSISSGSVSRNSNFRFSGLPKIKSNAS